MEWRSVKIDERIVYKNSLVLKRLKHFLQFEESAIPLQLEFSLDP
jgi:hypothetical protein